MSLTKIIGQGIEILKENTTGYIPNPTTMQSNKNKAIISGAVLLGMYILPGDQSLIEIPSMIYGGIKTYQAIRDWAGK